MKKQNKKTHFGLDCLPQPCIGVCDKHRQPEKLRCFGPLEGSLRSALRAALPRSLTLTLPLNVAFFFCLILFLREEQPAGSHFSMSDGLHWKCSSCDPVLSSSAR